MSSESESRWLIANQHYLSAAVNRVKAALSRHLGLPSNANAEVEVEAEAEVDLEAAERTTLAPAALETLCTAFQLSPFERDLLLLCAGSELDEGFASLLATSLGSATPTQPTFGLALAALSDAHWSALTPGAPLRYWRLIEVGEGPSPTRNPLRIDERVLHFLTGVQYLDDRLAGLVDPVAVGESLPPSHANLAAHIAQLWQSHTHPVPPAVQLCGAESASLRAVAQAACVRLGLGLCVLTAAALPADSREVDALLKLWTREAILSRLALLLDCTDHDPSDRPREQAITRSIERCGGILLIAGRERRSAIERPLITFDVGKPSPAEQRALWHGLLAEAGERLGGVHLNGHIDRVVAHFSLSLPAIRATLTEVLSQPEIADPEIADKVPDDELADRLWTACRSQARPRLDELARPLNARASWSDIVLPDLQHQTLRNIARHVRQRATVYESWGFAEKSARGLGISALFSGGSGTGKTLAAEVLANDLRLDLYHIDLSQVVSKYIGETEKNLRRVFDAAEEGGAVLFFDEADALFGKRSEVKDSHDRYANIEVSYLLQRMEAYRGLAILTTNMRSALDPAFLRRIRFIVHFPFPDVAQRAEIWRRVFPAATPTDALDAMRLAQLNVTGGNIRNIALNAAFLAADAGKPVRMTHLLDAAHMEYAKMEKPLSESELRGWV